MVKSLLTRVSRERNNKCCSLEGEKRGVFFFLHRWSAKWGFSKICIFFSSCLLNKVKSFRPSSSYTRTCMICPPGEAYLYLCIFFLIFISSSRWCVAQFCIYFWSTYQPLILTIGLEYNIYNVQYQIRKHKRNYFKYSFSYNL